MKKTSKKTKSRKSTAKALPTLKLMKEQDIAMDFAKKAGDFEEYQKLKETLNIDEQKLLDYRKSIKEIDKQIRNIYNLKEFPNGEIPTPDEKRELIDDYYKLMINFAQQALSYLELVREK